MTMDWNFASRSGDLIISHFDPSVTPDGSGLTFSGSMAAPGVVGVNQFGGTLSGALPGDLGALSGSAAESFARGPSKFDAGGLTISQSLPQGVIGNWNVVNVGRYQATGIFAGSLR
jgi:hypothetical protein